MAQKKVIWRIVLLSDAFPDANPYLLSNKESFISYTEGIKYLDDLFWQEKPQTSHVAIPYSYDNEGSSWSNRPNSPLVKLINKWLSTPQIRVTLDVGLREIQHDTEGDNVE